MTCTISLSDGIAPWLSRRSDDPHAETIHLSPANGIPIASYAGFIEQFNGDYSFTGMDSRGAWLDQVEPTNSFGLEAFADDLIEAIEQTYDAPIIGMGHSHGGLITAAAAVKRPELFSKLVIIETASMPTPTVGWLVTHTPKALAMKLFPIVRSSYKRQRIWPSREAFYRRYRNHATFRRFTERAMRDYVEYGLRQRDDNQYELSYHPSWESHIFRTVGFAWNQLRKLKVPSLLIRAEHSNLYSAEQFTQYNAALECCVDTVEIPGAHHLLTHENPIETAQFIQQWLKPAAP